MILSFQCIQTYIVDTFTLHAASGIVFPPVSTVPTSRLVFSVGCCCLPAVTSRFRISPICSSDVRCTWIREG
jgi:hypothetical protein